VFSGLSSAVSYTFTCVAENGNGAGQISAASPSVTVGGAPDPPYNITAIAGDSQAQVSFNAGSDHGNPVTMFTVTSSPAASPVSGTASPILVTGLSNSVVYTFTVTATNSIGTSVASVASNAVTPIAVPANNKKCATEEGLCEDDDFLLGFSLRTVLVAAFGVLMMLVCGVVACFCRRKESEKTVDIILLGNSNGRSDSKINVVVKDNDAYDSPLAFELSAPTGRTESVGNLADAPRFVPSSELQIT
jgi:hypothetical protein